MVTQEIQDIIGSEIVKEAIINNSDVVMLLDQSKFKERFDEIRKILGLTEVDCKKIFTINRLENKDGRSFFREVFIRRGTTSGVYGVEEPHECYMTYTTERAEKEALKLYKKELRCSHQEAIEAYCRDWDASGIGKSLPFAQKVNETGRVLNLRPVYESNKHCSHETTTPYPDHRLGRTLPDGSRPVLQRELRHPYRCGDGGRLRYGSGRRRVLPGAGR